MVALNQRVARRLICVLVALGAVIGCAGSHDVVSPRDVTTGTVTGMVTLLGTASAGVTSGHVSLYASVGDFEVRRAAYDVPLTPTQAGARTFSFVLEKVGPGSYYVTVCFAFGCGEYREPERGELVSVSVPARGATRLDLKF